MKRFISLLVLITILSFPSFSQCDNGSNYYPSSIYSPSPDSWGYASTCNWAGEVIRVNIFSGDSYQFSTCGNYGGVTASLAMLGDLVVAEPKARIGFSGKRVIQDTVKEELPENFQTAEKQLEKGFLDKIVDRRNLRDFLEKILTIME